MTSLVYTIPLAPLTVALYKSAGAKMTQQRSYRQAWPEPRAEAQHYAVSRLWQDDDTHVERILSPEE